MAVGADPISALGGGGGFTGGDAAPSEAFSDSQGGTVGGLNNGDVIAGGFKLGAWGAVAIVALALVGMAWLSKRK